METQITANKLVVRRFNKEVIEAGNVDSFNALMDDPFINHSACDSYSCVNTGMIDTRILLYSPLLKFSIASIGLAR